jgi:hypothetical protein
VKLSVLFRKEGALKDMVQDFYKYLTYAKSQENLTPSQTDTTSRSMLILSILAIQLHKHGLYYELVKCYECVLWWVDCGHNTEIKRRALECLCHFW